MLLRCDHSCIQRFTDSRVEDDAIAHVLDTAEPWRQARAYQGPAELWHHDNRFPLSAQSRDDITRLLHDWSQGDAAALPLLVEAVYPELRRIAARQFRSERPGHTLQPTAIVNEAYVRLARQQSGKQWQDRTHFFAVAARVVRAVLVDHARARQAVKRGSGAGSVELTLVSANIARTPLDVLDLDAALQALEAMDPEQVRIVELRYFAGLSIEETAEAIGASPSSVKRGWLAAKTYIRRHLDGDIARP